MARFYPSNIKIAIVGAGPCGIYCAIHILDEFKKNNFKNFTLDIFDKSQVLRTILPTGNGRCNITNSIDDIKDFAKNYPRGEKFLYSLFYKHSNFDSIDFFNSIGIETIVEPDGRVFPKSQNSKDVKDKLLNKLKSYNKANLINKKINSKDDILDYDKIIVCAGSRGTKELIESFSHTCIDFKKALCGLKIENSSIFPKGVSVKSLDGDFIFTNEGVSGPLIFKISSLNAYKNFPYDIEIKLFQADDLIKLVEKYPKKSISNLISNFIPKSLAKAIVANDDKNACEVSKEKLNLYSKLKLKVLSSASCGEIVNAGGVLLDELDKNCKSKLNDNLWFCGEILNIDGFCGGFNLQNCWSCGYVVAKDVVSSIINK